MVFKGLIVTCQYFINFINFSFLRKTCQIGVFILGFGPKLRPSHPDPTDGYFGNGNACMVHKYQLFISIFTILNLYGCFFSENLLNWCIYPRFWSQTGVFTENVENTILFSFWTSNRYKSMIFIGIIAPKGCLAGIIYDEYAKKNFWPFRPKCPKMG